MVLTAARVESLFRFPILFLICLLAFLVRLFAVIRFESIIHEFDPYFNFRTTKVLVSEGFYEFNNWFDNLVWYPLGRVVGSTVYPGLMMTAWAIHNILHFFSFTIDIRNVCVFVAPLWSATTALTCYAFASEIGGYGAGLFAAAFAGLVPSYISRSVAGSYDNEAVAIFAMIFAFYTFVRSVVTGSLRAVAVAVLAYFYMVATWGGYTYVINLIPLYVLIMLIFRRFSARLYVAYSVFYPIGTLLSMMVNFVGFNAVQSAEHAPAFFVFGFLQLFAFYRYLSSLVNNPTRMRQLILKLGGYVFAAIFGLFVLLFATSGFVRNLTGRSITLLDPTYASKFVPIIASVSEHQAPTWSSFFMDLHLLNILAPVGLYVCIKKRTDASIFLALYGLTTVYFASVMVRMMLVLAPIGCVLSGIGISHVFGAISRTVKGRVPPSPPSHTNRLEKRFAWLCCAVALCVCDVLCVCVPQRLGHVGGLFVPVHSPRRTRPRRPEDHLRRLQVLSSLAASPY